MTNTLQIGTYAILTLLHTNTVELGTFVPVGGAERWRVVEDSYVTNTIAVLEFENQQRSLLLKSERGPRICERRERKEPALPPMPAVAAGQKPSTGSP